MFDHNGNEVSGNVVVTFQSEPAVPVLWSWEEVERFATLHGLEIDQISDSSYVVVDGVVIVIVVRAA